jgi:hypothetical protein
VRRAYHDVAADFGRTLAERGIALVYGGGKVGLMGALADGALAAGGVVVGVIPRALVDREVAHEGLTELRVVDSMHERKALMADLADGFVALPGGVGTLEELFEIWSWAQLGLHSKPCGLIEVDGYFAPLIAFLEHAVQEGFLPAALRDILHVESDADALLDSFATYRAPAVRRWITPATT